MHGIMVRSGITLLMIMQLSIISILEHMSLMLLRLAQQTIRLHFLRRCVSTTLVIWAGHRLSYTKIRR